MAKSITELFEEIKGRTPKGGFIDPTTASGDLSKIFKDIEITGTRFSTNMKKSLSIIEEAFGGADKIDVAASKGIAEFKSAMMGLVTGSASFKDVAKSMSSMSDQLSKALLQSTSAVVTLVGDVVGIGADIVTYANTKMSMAWGGAEGAFKAFISTFTDGLKMMGGSMGKIGTMLDSVMGNAVKAFLFRYDDYLAAAETRQRARAQLGEGGRVEGVAREVPAYYSALGRDKAKEWGMALIDQGVAVEAGMMDRMIRIGKTMGIDASGMASVLNETLAVTSNAYEASDVMEKTFMAMQKAAEGTNLPVKLLAQQVREATVNARFMNVDMKTVSATMQMMTKDADKLKAMGIDLRKDGGKILSDMTNATNKATDAMHVFFGTKGGTAGITAMEGWAESKFGKGFVESLKATAGGGFEMEKGAGGEMMAQRLEVMKKTMIDASKHTDDASEKLFIQMKVATDTFGMSEETARMLAGKDLDQMKKIAENPALANEFKSSKQLLGELKSKAAINEGIQRMMASLSIQQLSTMLQSMTYLQYIALAELAGLEGELGATARELLTKVSPEAVQASMLAGFKGMGTTLGVLTNQLKFLIPPSLRKDFLDMLDSVKSITTAFGGFGVKRSATELMGGLFKQTGASQIVGAQKGVTVATKGMYEVVEDKRPEGFLGAGGDRIFFMPPEIGKILNYGELTSNIKDWVNKGLFSAKNEALAEAMKSLTIETVGGGAAGMGIDTSKLVAAMEAKKTEPMTLTNKEVGPYGAGGTQIVMNFSGILDKDRLESYLIEASREALLGGGV